MQRGGKRSDTFDRNEPIRGKKNTAAMERSPAHAAGPATTFAAVFGSHDRLLHLGSFLTLRELFRLLACGVRPVYDLLCTDTTCWKTLPVANAALTDQVKGFDSRFDERSDPEASESAEDAPMLRREGCFSPRISRLVDLYKTAEEVSELRSASWVRRPIVGDRPRPQEGHASAMLTKSHVAVLVGGFGLGIYQDVHISDALEWADGQFSFRCVDDGRGRTLSDVYGHQALAVNDTDTVAVFGGCAEGGYMGDVNDLEFLRLENVQDSPRAGDNRLADVQCTWWAPKQVPGFTATPRAYPSFDRVSVPVSVEEATDHSTFLVAFGGIHNGAACQAFESVEFCGLGKEYRWTMISAEGEPPVERFGHASAFDAGTRRLIIAGGSDGSDLLRDGDELNDVHVFTFGPATRSAQGVAELRGVWSQPVLNTPSRQLPEHVFARCCSHALVGRHLLCFGGGAEIGDDLVALHIDTMSLVCPTLRRSDGDGDDDAAQEGPVSARDAPVRAAQKPRKRLSHVWWQAGNRIVLFGGWGQRNLRDAWELRLSPVHGGRILGPVESGRSADSDSLPPMRPTGIRIRMGPYEIFQAYDAASETDFEMRLLPEYADDADP